MAAPMLSDMVEGLVARTPAIRPAPGAAEGWEVSADGLTYTFRLRAGLQWSDGTPLTADDFVYSYRRLLDPATAATTAGLFLMIENAREITRKARPPESLGVAAPDPRTVVFRLATPAPYFLQLLANTQAAPVPRHVIEKLGRDWTRAGSLVSNGPYVLAERVPQNYVRLVRNPNYRAVKEVRVPEVYWYPTQDMGAATRRFRAGELDTVLNVAPDDLDWIRTNRPRALHTGPIHATYLLVFNVTRPPFDDRRVRQALAHAFDFEWSNKNLFFDAYVRTRSFFDNSELAARGLPQGEELAILNRFRDRLPPEVFTTEYNPPKSDGTPQNRAGLREATRILREAGWRMADGKLVDASGRQMSFEFLLPQGQTAFERILTPFIQNLERLGIAARIRPVDVAQFQNRVDDFDFDVILTTFGQSESPGNEQRDYWSSVKADQKASRNYAGIKDPAIDELVELLIAAPDRASLVQRVRALDRVLQWGHWVIPNWYVAVDRVAAWDRFGWPETNAKNGFDWTSWWVDPQRDANLRARRPR